MRNRNTNRRTHKKEAEHMEINFYDPLTKWGWTIKSRQDIVTALMGYEAFSTTSPGYIEEAIAQAAQDRTNYADIEDLAKTILTKYI